MYVHVKSFSGTEKITLTISRLTTVGTFKKLIGSELDVPVKSLRLFFKGKQLENGYKLFDYNVNFNDVIQYMVVDEAALEKKSSSESKSKSEYEEHKTEEKKEKDRNNAESLFFNVGDTVEVKDKDYFGSWFEGVILSIHTDLDKPDCDPSSMTDDGLIYKVHMLRFPHDPPSLSGIKELRPRSREIIPLSKLSVGDKVMINYNMEEPKQRGYWYDFTVSSIKPLTGTLYAGVEDAEMEKVTVKFPNEIFNIEKTKLKSERSPEELALMQKETDNPREYAPYCSKCKDDTVKPCKECSCQYCGGKDSPNKQVFCDECNCVFHLWCLKPPLKELPTSDQWYCYDCKNDENEIVKAGEKLKASKKKEKLVSSNSKSGRDWGKGMACVGRTKQCTIVPMNHFGPIPGVEVGTTWKFRVQVSEAGVHRPHVAGIAGRENDGAYSIVLSGGYEDDVDNGEEFIYTGSGGRDLSGNKRTADQSSDQTLTRMNKALALNCNASFDDEKGGTSKSWKQGKPVRVVRNYKAARHSKYAPEEGNRYDGLYKVVKYYPEKGKSGYIVWKFLLRRDDESPAPWTAKGKERMESLGLEIIYPDGYLEAMESKEKLGSKMGKRESSKRVLEEVGNNEQSSPPAKKTKLCIFKLDKDVETFIDKDEINSKLWSTAKDSLSLGKQKFLVKVEELFTCICCQELLFKPVGTPCKHNVCIDCLKQSFAAEVYACPYCRTELGKDFQMDVNESLQSALLSLFPGYSADR